MANLRGIQTTNAALTGGNLTLRHVWLRGGLAQGGGATPTSSFNGGGGAGLGGAVYNRGTLTVEQGTLSANTAQGGNVGLSSTIGGVGGGGLGGGSGINSIGGTGGGGFGGNSAAASFEGSGGGGTVGDSSGQTGGALNGGNGSDDGDGTSANGGGGGYGGGGGGSGSAGYDATGNSTTGMGGAGGLGGGGGGGSASNSVNTIGGAGGAGGFGGGGGNGGNANSGFFGNAAVSATGGAGGAGGFGGGGGGGGGAHTFPGAATKVYGALGAGGFGGGNGGSPTSGIGAPGGGGAGMGGAIFNDGGTLVLTNSTLSANTARGGDDGASGAADQAGQGLGGAVFARNGQVTINHVTLNANTVTQGPGPAPTSAPTPAGGALYLLGDGETVYMDGARTTVRPNSATALSYSVSNTILANTTDTASDVFVHTINSGAVNAGTNTGNLAEANGAGANALPGVAQTADPALGPLQLNAPGATPTHAITEGAAAHNTTACIAGVITDQRGIARPQGAACDIGAFEIACQAITVSPASGALPSGTTGVAYSQSFTQTGGSGATSFSRSAGALPPGLTLSTGGVLSGTPSQAGAFSFTVTATDVYGCAGSQAYSVTIVCPVLTLNPASLPNGTAGAAYSQTLTVTGGFAPYNFTATGLPAWLALNTSTGVLSGTPPAAGTFNFTVNVADGYGCTTSRGYSITVAPGNCATISPLTIKQPYVSVLYVELLSASPAGGYSYSVVAGALPPGLHLVTAFGLTSIAGIPTTPGAYAFTIKARRNGTTCEGTRSYTVTIPATVAPILECVQRNQNGSWTARFGYDNSTGAAVTIPVGANNYFTPGNQNRGQTTLFQPGRVTSAFSVTFTKGRSNNLAVWFLRGPDGVLRPVSVLTTSIGCP